MRELVHVALAAQYAQGVVGGKTEVCKWARLACARHLEDVKRSKAKAYPWCYDEEKADRVCRFISQLPHTKGAWFLRNELIKLEPWQCFLLCTIFGWVSKATGQRRFRRAYVEVPRKNAKSTLAAAIGLYCFAADGEAGAEVYSGATTERQAWEVFRPARLMAERTVDLREAFGIEVGAKNLHVPATGSRMEPMIGKPGDGASPSCAIIDEYHEHDTDEQADTMLTGMGARAMEGSPLMLYITTAGDNLAGPCYALRSEVQKVLDGALEGDSIFGTIYALDDADDWTTEAALRKANPNFDVSIGRDFLLDEQRRAIGDARKQGIFKTKHLNTWVTQRSAWMNMEAWKRCGNAALTFEDCVGLPCWVGLDMAPKTDFCSAVFVFKDGDGDTPRYRVLARHFLPEATAYDPSKQHYAAWAASGRIVVAGEEEIAFGLVADVLGDLIEQAHPQELVYDVMYGAEVTQRIEERTGVVRVQAPMAHAKSFSPAMVEVEAAVASRRLQHDDDPVLTWMVSNVVAKTTDRKNQFPVKQKPEHKIDGAIALLLAVGRAQLGESEQSIYNTRGLLTLGASP